MNSRQQSVDRARDEEQLILDTNRALYEKIGCSYSDGKDDLRKIVECGAYTEFISHIPKSGFVLDVGAGAGDFVKKLSQDGFRTAALEISSSFIKRIKKTSPRTKISHIDALDIDTLPDKYDGITAVHLIQHFNKRQLVELFEKIFDRLNKGGVFLLVFTNTCYEKTGLQPENDEPGAPSIFWHKWELEDIAPMLAKAKFKILRFDVQQSHFPFIFISRKDK